MNRLRDRIFNSKMNKQSGVVSIFVVIFATLLITVVTVSFIRIMIQSQQRAVIADLSQSAYDSAQAGVEDAKRALLKYQSVCSDSSKSVECEALKSIFNNHTSADCLSSISGVLGDIDVTDKKEIKIQQNLNDNASVMDQAYTCIKIILNTDDYRGFLKQDETKIISLKGVSDFDSIKLEWFMKDKDFTGNKVDFPKNPSSTPLDKVWPTNRPSIMRAQLIQFDDTGFLLGDFSEATNSSTLFLYPSTTGSVSPSFALDKPRREPSRPIAVKCLEDMTSRVYSCTATMNLLSISNRVAYLRLTSHYNKANYRIQLLNKGTMVKFNEVQPSIDSTGRANDLLRRVDSRVEFGGGFPYPQAAVDINGNFCKNFFITDDVSDYSDNVNGECKP